MKHTIEYLSRKQLVGKSGLWLVPRIAHQQSMNLSDKQAVQVLVDCPARECQEANGSKHACYAGPQDADEPGPAQVPSRPQGPRHDAML